MMMLVLMVMMVVMVVMVIMVVMVTNLKVEVDGLRFYGIGEVTLAQQGTVKDPRFELCTFEARPPLELCTFEVRPPVELCTFEGRPLRELCTMLLYDRILHHIIL